MRLTGQHGVGQYCHTQADKNRQPEVAYSPGTSAQARAQWGDVFVASRQPAQTEQDQYRRHHLHDQLSQRQIRCREPDEGDAGHQAADADHDQCCQTVILALPGCTYCAGNCDKPERDKHPGTRNLRPVAPGQATEIHRDEAAQYGCQYQQKQLRLQATSADLALETPRPVHHHHLAAFEKELAVEPAHQRRGSNALVLERFAQQ